MVGLGKELVARGHHVVVSAPADFEGFVTSEGLSYHRGSRDFSGLMDIERGTEAKRGFGVLGRLASFVPEHFSRLREAAKTADVVVGSMLQLAGPSVADAYGIPYYYVVFAPNWL